MAECNLQLTEKVEQLQTESKEVEGLRQEELIEVEELKEEVARLNS